MTQILVCGVAVLDLVFQVDAMPRAADKYRAREATLVGGGCAANAAVAIARLGGKAILAARLGADIVGDVILENLGNEGVDTGLVKRLPQSRSSISSVYVDNEGERQIMNFRGAGLADDPAWISDAPPVDAVLADNRWEPGTMAAMDVARKYAIPGIIDGEAPISAETLRGASHIAFSRPGLTALTGETDIVAALKLSAAALDCWQCVTDGEQGVYFTDHGKVEHIAAFRVETRDTLAAGDVWHGAFALRLSEGANEAEAIEFANAAAALKCTRFGGLAGSPDRNATERLIKEGERCN